MLQSEADGERQFRACLLMDAKTSLKRIHFH